MSRQTRRQVTPQEKIAALRRHLFEGTRVSDLCDQLGIQPTLCYTWQKTFFENGTAAFDQTARGRKAGTDAKDRKIAALEAKFLTKNEVLAELMEEHVQLKKNLGNPDRMLGPPRHPRPSH
jgi:transposase-like protein